MKFNAFDDRDHAYDVDATRARVASAASSALLVANLNELLRFGGLDALVLRLCHLCAVVVDDGGDGGSGGGGGGGGDG